MAVSTISTYAAVQSTLNDVSKVVATLQQQQAQVSSGNASQDFASMGGSVQQYLSLDSILARTDQYLNDNKIMEARLNSTADALSSMIKMATELQNLISQRRTGVANSAAFGLQVEGLYQQFAVQMNSSVDGRYLFSGSDIRSPAIDVAEFPQLIADGEPDTGYYLGNSQEMRARPQDNVSVVYNVPGDAPAFQDMIASMVTARSADAGKSQELFEKAYNLVQRGLKGLVNLKAVVDDKKVLFTNTSTQLQNSRLYYQGLQQSIGNTDLVSVSTQIATNQAILQASFSVYAKINALRLSDYLK